MPHHVDDAIATIAALHAAHHREARALQRTVSRATSDIAQLGTLILITLAIALWVTINLTLPEFSHAALESFPFSLLGTIVSTIALPHDNDPHDTAPRRRDGYARGADNAGTGNLERAEVIQNHRTLLEEFRRNDPNQGDHRDEVAEALAEPADAQVVLDAIRAAEKADDAQGLQFVDMIRPLVAVGPS